MLKFINRKNRGVVNLVEINQLERFKPDSDRFDTPYGRESLTLQHNLAYLDLERELLISKYKLTELQLKDLLFGTPTNKEEEILFNVIYTEIGKVATDIKRGKKLDVEKRLSNDKKRG